MNWNFRGIYPHEKPDIFYGQRGLIADTGNPLPSATLAASAETVTTPGDVTIQAYAVNTVGFQWQVSADGEEWVNITGQISKTLERFYPHIAGTAGTYFYRVLCAGWLGVVPSPVVTVNVSYAVPTVSATASAEFVPNAGTVILTASAKYADSIEWQVSRDILEWVSLGITTPEAVIEYAPEDGGEYFYRCEAVGLGGTVYSIPVSVDVEYHVPIISISSDVSSIISPGTVTFTASAEFTTRYEWEVYTNGVWTFIQGGDVLTVTYAEGDFGEFKYRCTATGNGGFTHSEIITITVECPPPIISIAADVASVESPGTATITATAHLTNSYVWEVSADGITWAALEGETGETVTVSYAEGEEGEFSYRCIASGNGGETTSEAVVIVVTVPEVEEPEPETPTEEETEEETGDA